MTVNETVVNKICLYLNYSNEFNICHVTTSHEVLDFCFGMKALMMKKLDWAHISTKNITR